MPPLHAADGRNGHLFFSLSMQLPGLPGLFLLAMDICQYAFVNVLSCTYVGNVAVGSDLACSFVAMTGLLVLRPLHYGADERQMPGMQTGGRR